jgi:hypothetical protein
VYVYVTVGALRIAAAAAAVAAAAAAAAAASTVGCRLLAADCVCYIPRRRAA